MSAAEVAERFCAEIGDGYRFARRQLREPRHGRPHGRRSRRSSRRSRRPTAASAGSSTASPSSAASCLITADHGNAEQLLEADGVSPHTAHTTNPVPLVVTDRGRRAAGGRRTRRSRPDGAALLGLEPPAGMTGKGFARPARPACDRLTSWGDSSSAVSLSLATARSGVLRRAQRGDERAFALIVRAYETPVFNYVLRLVGDRALAEDLTQEVFVRVFQGLPKFSLALQVHDVALPGDEEPRAGRAPRPGAPAAAPVDARRRAARSRSSTRRSSGARRSTPCGARCAS